MDYYRRTTTGMPGGVVTAHFFPRAVGDHILEFLAATGCRVDTTIRIAMSEWDSYRIAIAERLVELADQGCHVRIVYAKMDSEVRELLSSHGEIAIRKLGDARNLPGYLHSKYMILEELRDRVCGGQPLKGPTSPPRSARRRGKGSCGHWCACGPRRRR